MASKPKQDVEAAPDPEPIFAYKPLRPVSDYTKPAMPADETLRLLWSRTKSLIKPSGDAPHIASEQLEQTTMGLLDDVVSPPACGPVIEEVELSVAAWCAGDPIPSNMLIVLPPCDENNVIEQWALDHEHEILESPSRQQVISAMQTSIPDLDGEGLLVIPRLEDWFLRHRNGLTAIRNLLAELDATPRRCVIGCNSWAWDYLEKAVEADLILPSPQTFQPYDAKRLHQWLEALANPDSGRTITFRRSKSGKDVMRVDEKGAPESDFLKKLAARSMGIPWIAWHMWRRSLRSDREDEAKAKEKEDATAPAEEENTEALASSTVAALQVEDNSAAIAEGRRLKRRRSLTLWVADVEETLLPSRHMQDALLMLHVLLIHGNLTALELREAVPLVGSSYVLATLVAKGFVTRDGDALRCHPAAYPQIRSALASAGFPVAAL